jgi:arylsulfatase A-like enzyme
VHGVIYTSLTATKVAEHGGFAHDDTNVPILVSGPTIGHEINLMPVQTAQIAPTILQALGLNPSALRGVQLEGTRVLPLLSRGQNEDR